MSGEQCYYYQNNRTITLKWWTNTLSLVQSPLCFEITKWNWLIGPFVLPEFFLEAWKINHWEQLPSSTVVLTIERGILKSSKMCKHNLIFASFRKSPTNLALDSWFVQNQQQQQQHDQQNCFWKIQNEVVWIVSSVQWFYQSAMIEWTHVHIYLTR